MTHISSLGSLGKVVLSVHKKGASWLGTAGFDSRVVRHIAAELLLYATRFLRCGGRSSLGVGERHHCESNAPCWRQRRKDSDQLELVTRIRNIQDVTLTHEDAL